MTHPLRYVFHRIALLGALAILCGAASCELRPTEIGYAPGVGYVVRAMKPHIGQQQEFHTMYIFPTEERAREFFEAYRTTSAWPNLLRDGEREIDQDDLEFYRILDLMRQGQQPPPPVNDVTAPLVAPELPQPIPATPQ